MREVAHRLNYDQSHPFPAGGESNMERDDERIGMAVVTFLHRRIEMEAKFVRALLEA